ncbi:MAG TPA: TonB family protein [Sphingomicrobium sp.]|nr:TonB family protein [Sphingomicrobium sp.]
MAYRAEDRSDRWKAMLASVFVTGILGAVILSGLNVKTIGEAVDHLETFDIPLPEIPPPDPPPPPPRPAQEESGSPAAPKASPIVAPKPEVQLPSRQVIAAATEAGTGASSAAGQGGVGTGTGAGGTGTGLGRGSGAGFTPAQRISKVPNSQYRQLAAVSGIRNGRVGITIKVDTSGQATNCRVISSSGSPAADSLMCRLTEQYVRFRPARDPQGRPVAQDISWYPNWSPR